MADRAAPRGFQGDDDDDDVVRVPLPVPQLLRGVPVVQQPVHEHLRQREQHFRLLAEDLSGAAEQQLRRDGREAGADADVAVVDARERGPQGAVGAERAVERHVVQQRRDVA